MERKFYVGKMIGSPVIYKSLSISSRCKTMLIQIFINQYKYILAAWGMEMINLDVNIHVFSNI